MSARNPKHKGSTAVGSNSSGPLVNLLQNKRPPVSIHLRNGCNQVGSSAATASSTIGFTSGYEYSYLVNNNKAYGAANS